jgi:hypothetical protein
MEGIDRQDRRVIALRLAIALSVCALASLSLSNPFPARAQSLADSKTAEQSIWDRPEFKAASAATLGWDCKKGWDIRWPLAKAGSAEARYGLWTSTIFNTNPPGTDRETPAIIRERHGLILAAYGALARLRPEENALRQKALRNNIVLYLRNLSVGGPTERVAQCYRSGTAFSECLDLAVSLGLIPKFADYAQEVELAERETGKPASCLYPH